ncbi:MAG: DNA mismatch repair protein MutS [Planctomycetota bacterium]|jgi:DNA mismatch repair protein MutS|nr:DNA mismatch repair protein MutS [Planctomycetota bacterium]
MPDPDNLTPAMRQWQDAKDRHPDKILLFRMGDFYEMFNQDAVNASRLLGLTLTKRSNNASPLAGVPASQIDRYVKEFVAKGLSVVVCDQLEDPLLAKGVVKRGITRVVTPGTLVDESVLPPRANNFLAAVTQQEKDYALAFVDVSTGEFFLVSPERENLEDEFFRQSPAETLLPREIAGDPEHPLARLLATGIGGGITRRDSYQFDPREGETRLKQKFAVTTLDSFGIATRPACLGAAGAILAYLEENYQDSLAHLKPPVFRDHSGYLVLDRNSIHHLELLPPTAQGRDKHSLLTTIDRTLTGPGSRLLRSWLLRPLAEVEPIRKRQEAVMELRQENSWRQEIRTLLADLPDLERIAARLAAHRASPRDLVALAGGCRILPRLAACLAGAKTPLLQESAVTTTLEDVAELIEAAIVAAPPASAREGGVIREGFDPEVDELRRTSALGKDWLQKFQEAEQRRTGIASLKIGYNRVFGYYLDIPHTHQAKVPADYTRKQTLANSERYLTPALKEQESLVLGAEDKLLQREGEIFTSVRDQVAGKVGKLQVAAALCASLDCLAALAELAATANYVMPEVHAGLETWIKDGRHPTLEQLVPAGEFVANDLTFEEKRQRLLIITGPNMAGKSTYIRQNAILFILAHMGSAIPASQARIGLADRVFTRVGAGDDLARGLSTFMVEMVETANILLNASERSLVILDEVGRGTSTFDGVSLAWAITEYLHQVVGARTLFATHYHELAELGRLLERAKNFNVTVKDWQGKMLFLHRIEPGAANRSYGLQVASMAGIPRAVVERARVILQGLETQAAERDYKLLGKNQNLLRAAGREVQGALFQPPRPLAEVARDIILELGKIDPGRLTPGEAQTILERLVEKARNGT